MSQPKSMTLSSYSTSERTNPETPTPYAVHCLIHGKQYLTYDLYVAQLLFPQNQWRCPHTDRVCCWLPATWDDENFQLHIDKVEDPDLP